MIKSCERCGLIFETQRERQKFASRLCATRSITRSHKNEYWWVSREGYIVGNIRLPDGGFKRVQQHRFIYEQYHGIIVPDTHDVHHINNLRNDNRIENLEMIPKDEHGRMSAKIRVYSTGYKMNISREQAVARAFKSVETKRRKYNGGCNSNSIGK